MGNEKEIILVSDRDKKMVKMLADGESGVKIAKTFSVNKNTLATQMAELRKKMGCKNSTHLVAYFFKNGLID